MSESPRPFGVEFDARENGWLVKMPKRRIVCHSEAEANCIAALPVIHAEACEHDLLDADDPRKEAFCQTAKRVLLLVNQYGARCVASRDVERALMQVENCLGK